MADVFDLYVKDNRTIQFKFTEPIMLEDSRVTDWVFHIPRILNNIDMSGWAWWLVYINARGQKYSELLELSEDPESPLEKCIATYSVDYGMSIKAGIVRFSLETINTDTGGEILNEWHTQTYQAKVQDTLQGNQVEYAETESDIISALIVEVQNKVSQLVGGATPEPKSLIAEMTDTKKVYLYVGEESGESTNYWYYYNGSAWVVGGLYASGTIVDATPTRGSANAVSSGGVWEDVDGISTQLADNGLATPMEWMVGKRINISNDVAGNPASNASWRCIKTDCAEGDTFIISATTDSANNYRAWAFVRDDNTVISKCAQVQSVYQVLIVAPAGTSYLICNDKNSGSVCYKGEFIANVLSGLSAAAFKNVGSIGDTSYTSLNDIAENSVYQVQANSVSDMPVNKSLTVITNLFSGNTYRNQIAIRWGNGDVYYRYLSGGTWSAWQQYITGYSESLLTSSDDLNNLGGKTIALVKSGASNLPANYPALFGTNGGVFITYQIDTDLMQVGIENKKGISVSRTKTGSTWSDWGIYALSACGSLADNSDANDRYGFILDGIQVNRTIANYPKLKDTGKAIAGSLLTIPTYGATIRQQVVLPFYTDAVTQENREELGVYMRRLQGSTITPWNYFKMVPRNRNAKYIAFGDSTTWGYSADHDHAQSPWNYPAMVGDLLGMRVSNLADPAQGMIKDWSVGTSGNFAVIPTINEMITNGDFDDVKLITVGWAYNDADFYSTLDFGNPTDAVPESTEGITTWLGYYCKILDILQRAAPQALVILITGYGYTKATEGHKTDEQFSKVRTFRDGGKSMKQMYDGLEEMANYNGYCCINQAKGCAITRANGSTIIGDSIHPTYDNYRIYGDNISSRIVALFNNRIVQ